MISLDLDTLRDTTVIGDFQCLCMLFLNVYNICWMLLKYRIYCNITAFIGQLLNLVTSSLNCYFSLNICNNVGRPSSDSRSCVRILGRIGPFRRSDAAADGWQFHRLRSCCDQLRQRDTKFLVRSDIWDLPGTSTSFL